MSLVTKYVPILTSKCERGKVLPPPQPVQCYVIVLHLPYLQILPQQPFAVQPSLPVTSCIPTIFCCHFIPHQFKTPLRPFTLPCRAGSGRIVRVCHGLGEYIGLSAVNNYIKKLHILASFFWNNAHLKPSQHRYNTCVLPASLGDLQLIQHVEESL